jgi:hypothetical protein
MITLVQFNLLFGLILLASSSLAGATPSPADVALQTIAERCHGFEIAEPISFKRNAPEPEIIQGQEFPRNQRTLYRGTGWDNPQVSLRLALSAMLEAPDAYVGSALYMELRQLLLRAHTLEESKMRPRLNERGLTQSIKLLVSCSTFTEAEASHLAANLVDRALDDVARRDNLMARYADEKSGKFDDWPAEIVYSSAYQVLAATYGGQMLEIRDPEFRALDKHFWQLKKTGTPLEQHPTIDAGEMILPGYIRPQDILGYQLRVKDDCTIWSNWAARYREISDIGTDWAFEKITVAGRPAVIILDAGGVRCIERGKGEKIGKIDHFYSCARNFGELGTSGIKNFPLLEPEKELPAIGIIASCGSRADCTRLDLSGVLEEYPVSHRGLTKKILTQIQKVASVGKERFGLFTAATRKPLWVSSHGLMPEIELITPVVRQMKWSSAGPIAGMTCVSMNEWVDPHGWDDNFLCFDRDYGFQWAISGPGAGTCVKIDEPSDNHTWQDNFICSPQDYGLKWSSKGPIEDMDCLPIDEPADPDTWNDNFLCRPKIQDFLKK